MQKLFILLFVMTGAVMSCNNNDSSGTPAVSSVDSAAKAAPDTIRPSMDTTSVRLSAGKGGKDSL